MAKLSTLKADPKKEADGIWETYPGSDVMCRIARIGNPRFQAAARKMRRDAKMRAAAEGVASGALSGDSPAAKAAVAPAIAEYVLLEIKNLQADDDSTIDGTRLEERIKVLQDPQMHDFYDWVLGVASNANAYRVEAEEATAGNS